MDNRHIKCMITSQNANNLVEICEGFNFDINVVSGRVCVDGKSIVGVLKMCGRVVTLAPVTDDEYDIETFYRKVKPLGAFKEEF